MVDIGTLSRITLIGLQLGLTFVLITLGLTLIFGMMDVINIAHGSLFMLGAYFALSITQSFGSFWLALLVAPLLVGVVGVVIEVFSIRPLYGRDPLYHILLTFGLTLVMQGIVERVWGTNVHSIAVPPSLSGSVVVGSFTYPKIRMFVFLASVALVVLLWAVFKYSDYGVIMRACGHDSELVDSLGVDVSKVYTAVFGFGAWLAGVAGVLFGASRAVSPSMGTEIIIIAFAIIIIGGIGSFMGAVVAALLVGLLQSYGAFFIPSYVNIVVFLLMAVVLLFRPSGLFGSPEVT